MEAEGVETEAELTTLARLGIEKAQGFLLYKPMSLAVARDAQAASQWQTVGSAPARPALHG